MCSKYLNIRHVLKNVTKIVNYIRARGLNHRQFIQFMQDIDSEYTDVPYYTEIRWLSSHKVLRRFFELRNEIAIFLKSKNYECEILNNDRWIKDLAFAVDITNHLNQLNLKLQGKNLVITNLYDNIKAFKYKLLLWEKQLQEENLSHFDCCKSLLQKLPDLNFSEYSHQINSLRIEFERRFLDFSTCENQFQIFTSPFSVDVETVDKNLQLELIEMQCDSVLKQKFTEVGVPKFYNYLSINQFPNILLLAKRVLAMFGSTYLCEQLFSILKNNKTPERSRLTDQHVQSILKIATTNEIEPNFEDLVKEKRCQASSKQ